MVQSHSLGQWFRFLSAPTASDARRAQPAARDATQAITALARSTLLAELELLVANPIRVTDDGDTRTVTAFDSVSYGYSRCEKVFFAGLREHSGNWRHVPDTDPNSVIFDTYLPMRAWRRRVAYTLQRIAYQTLVNLVDQSRHPLDDDHDTALLNLCYVLVNDAWRGLHMRARLRARICTKDVRRRIREAMKVEEELLALARAARFRSRNKAITQQWLSFVWQHQDTLQRIRVQTPTMLSTVAEHMYRHGVDPLVDPTKACLKWLISRGLSKRGNKLLAKYSERPFREVICRFNSTESLDALLLALFMTKRGHEARIPRPLFYRVTMDEFGLTMTAARIRERLAVVPTRVFAEASNRLYAAAGNDAIREVALEYRTISAWWVACNAQVHAQAGWARWLELARTEDARQRMAAESSSWPCALEELKTPTAEVLALSTPLSLFEEGRALRHCAYAYVGRCLGDQVRLFSARMEHQGSTERATIGLQHGPRGWRIWDIRGACNRRMGGHWIPLARQVAEAYTRRDGSTQLLLPIHRGLDGT